ncbi:MAG: stage V sporulation protein AA [Limnochordia bacterium]|jgi:stage V sporulation protein AA
MDQDRELYMRIRERIAAKPGDVLTVGQIAEIVTDPEVEAHAAQIQVGTVEGPRGSLQVISTLDVIKAIRKSNPNFRVFPFGPAAVIITIDGPEKQTNLWNYLYFALIWLLLFIGAGMALMNFHADVGMAEVHRTIYRLVTGRSVRYPLPMQAAYSVGVGLGMAVFFNQLSRSQWAEPSPLEVEIDSYLENVNKHVIHRAQRKGSKEGGDG